MEFKSKFNIGDWVCFVDDKEVRGTIKTVSFSADLGTYYSAKLDNGEFHTGINETHLEKVERLFKFAGCKVTQGNDKSKVQIGCKTVIKQDIESLLDLADKFKIFDFSVVIYNSPISSHMTVIRIEQVRELYAKFFESQSQSEFEQFLIDNGIYEIFIYNVNAYGSYKSLSELESKHHISGLIMHAFGWGRTPEGANFWQKWDSKWVQYLNQK